MNFLPIATLAYLLNAIAVTIDKFLLSSSVRNPLAYVFYISLASLLALLLFPFTHIPETLVFILASISTLLWTTGAYFMFSALKVGQVSRVIPIIGTLTPLFLLVFAWINSSLSTNEIWAAGILILGLILITADSLKGSLKKNEAIFEIVSAFMFALSYLVLKEAFLRADFLTVLVQSRIILIPLLLIIFANHKLKEQIFDSNSKPKFNFSVPKLFFFGQILGGSSQLLLNFSISLASPAIVNSLQGVQYVFLFLIGLVLSSKFPKIFTEKLSFLKIMVKVLAIALIGLGLYILSLPQTPQTPQIGVSFSPRYAYQLGMEPKSTYSKILDTLNVKKIRLPIYWDEVETFPNQFNFAKVDFYLEEAVKKDVQIILVLGYKQPRWPECFPPIWVSKLMRKDRDLKILDLVEREVLHFKKFTNISAWQVENEPFLGYGVCDKVDSQTKIRVQKEIDIIKSLDKRPILLTDSGELSLWANSIKYSDIFGTTIYRTVWDKFLGTIDYPLPPIFYTAKNNLVRKLVNKKGPTIISELQVEPWLADRKSLLEEPTDSQAKTLPVEKMAGYVSFAKETGFDSVYLWGVEWWYFMAAHGHPEYLEYAKGLFR